MNKKKLLYVGLLSTAVLAFAACGGDKKADTAASSGGKEATGDVEQVFNVNVQAEMPTADLSLNTDVIGAVALNNVYEGLYRINADQKPEPAGAAEMAEISEDGLTYKIKLREDAKWSDGEPVTAKDYVFGW